MDINVLKIDLGETVFSFTGLNEAGAFVFHKSLRRHQLLGSLDGLSPRVV